MLTLTDDKLLKFVLILGKSCVAFVWGEKLGCPRTLFIILLMLTTVQLDVEPIVRCWQQYSGMLGQQSDVGNCKVQYVDTVKFDDVG